MKPEVWSRATERYKIEDDSPPLKRVPEPAKKDPIRRSQWKTKPGTGAYYLPACACCKMQFEHKEGCPLEHVMTLGKQHKYRREVHPSMEEAVRARVGHDRHLPDEVREYLEELVCADDPSIEPSKPSVIKRSGPKQVWEHEHTKPAKPKKGRGPKRSYAHLGTGNYSARSARHR